MVKTIDRKRRPAIHRGAGVGAKRRLSLGSSLIVALVWTSALAAADPKPETIRRGKSATALVVLNSGRGFASAFCIDPSGYFVTNYHVAVESRGRKTLELVLNSAGPNEQTVEVEVIRSDKTADLALLRARGDGKYQFTALEIGGVDALIETQHVVTFGSPFGTALAVQKKDYPGISVTAARITALHKTKGRLQRIELDARFDPGSAGGPVLDAEGKVVGIVRTGILGAGVNSAISVNQLDDFLGKPELMVSSPTVPFKNRHDPLELTIRMVRLSRSRPKLDVEVEIGEPPTATRLVATRLADTDVYRVSVVPVARSKTAPLLPIVMTFAGGTVRCRTPDRDVVLDGKKYRLSKISRITRSEQGNVVVFKDGEKLSGKELFVGKLKAKFGAYVAQFDADRARAISVYHFDPVSDKIEFRVVVKRHGAQREDGVVAAASGVISLERPPVKGIGAASSLDGRLSGDVYQSPQGTASFDENAEKVIYQMPYAYARYTLAGSGRYFVFHLKEARKLVIMDVLSGKTAAEIPGVMDDAMIAGGAEQLIIVLPGQRLIQRFSLKTFKREKVAPLPGQGTTRAALMGSNSRGPLLLCADKAMLVDLETLQPMKLKGTIYGGPRTAVSISYNGRTVTTVRVGVSPVEYQLAQIRGKTITGGSFGRTSNAGRASWPTADGSLLTLPGGGLYDANRNQVAANWLGGSTLFPTVDPRYFLSVKFAKNEQGADAVHVRVCTTAGRRIVSTYVGLEEMAPRGNSRTRRSYEDALRYGRSYYHYIPWANVLISMPSDKKQIVLRRFDLMKSIEATGKDYLFVDSVPPTEAFKGRTLIYRIATKSKRGGVTYKLESGPEGMRVTTGGLLTWNVPPDLADKTVQAIVTVADASGQDVFHSLQMAVRD